MEKVTKFIHLLMLLVVYALLNGCGGGGSEPENDDSNNPNEPPTQAFEEFSLFPIAPQCKWFQYHSDSWATTVGSPLTIKGSTVYPLNFDEPFGVKEYFSTTKNDLSYFGIFVPVVGEPGNYFTADVKFDRPVLLFSRDWEPGYTSSFERNTSINIQPIIGMRAGNAIGKVTYYGHEFTGENYIARDRHHIRYELQLDATINGELHRVNYDIHLWLVEGIGIVRRSENGFLSELTSTEGIPNRLYFSTPQGAEIPPRAQQVSNYQTRPWADFRDKEIEITYGGSTNWLNYIPPQYWNEPYLQPTTSNLPLGEHKANLTFDGDTSNSLSMEIIYTIVAPNLSGPASIDFNLSPTFTLEDLNQTVSVPSNGRPLHPQIISSAEWINVNELSTDESYSEYSIELDLNALLERKGTINESLTFTYDNGEKPDNVLNIPILIQLPASGIQIPEITLVNISGKAEQPAPMPITYLGQHIDLNQYSPTITYNNQANWLTIENDDQNDQLLASITRSNLPPGDYNADITLTHPQGNSIKATVRYHVEAPQLVPPSMVSWEIDELTTTEELVKQLTFRHTGELLNWHLESSAPWLAPQQVGNTREQGGIANVSLDREHLSTLENGQYETTLRLIYSGQYVSETTIEIPVTITVNFPSIRYALPYVIYEGKSEKVNLNGTKLSNLNAVGVSLLNSEQSEIELNTIIVKDDSEANIEIPPLSPGEYRLHVHNHLGISHTGSRILVHPTLNYEDAVVPLNGLARSIVYDEERQAFYVIWGDNTWNPFWASRIRYQGNRWITENIVADNPQAFSLSPDGQQLLLTTSSCTVNDVDFETLAITPIKSDPYCYGNYDMIAHFNDEQILLAHRDQWPHIRSFPDFQNIQYPSVHSPRFLLNKYRNKLLWGGNETITPTNIELYSYDPKTRNFNPEPNLPISRLSIDASASRISNQNQIYDENFRQIGVLEGYEPHYSDVIQLSPDGARAFAFKYSDYVMPYIDIYDTSTNSGPFPKVGESLYLQNGLIKAITDIVLPQNGSHAFLFGFNPVSYGVITYNLVVMKLPTDTSSQQ